MAAWDAARYLAFEDERTRPARELLARVPLDAPRRVVDLGCGPGNSTVLLIERYPQAEVIGVDTSPEMLAAARKRLPAVRFVEGDASDWTPAEPVDLIFANAVLQWVPDHLEVMARLLGHCSVLAVQMPDNFGEPTHRLMREVAVAGAWREKFATPVRNNRMAEPSVYYERLRPLAARVDIWHTIYQHVMDGPRAILDWVMSTGLRPFLERLDPAERDAYLAEYGRRLDQAFPPLADGKVLFRFPRLFVVAVR